MHWIIRHQIKRIIRAFDFKQNAGGSIILLIGFGIIAAELIAFGLFLPDMLDKAETIEKVRIFCTITGVYLFADIALKLLFVQVPDEGFAPYRLLPVKPSLFAHFANLQTIVTPLSLLPFFFVLPFVAQVFPGQYSGLTIAGWLLGYLFWISFNSLLVVWLLRKTGSGIRYLLILAVTVASLAALHSAGVINMGDTVAYLMFQTLTAPILALLPLLLATIVYLLNMRFVMRQRYPENQPFAKLKQRQTIRNNKIQWFANPYLQLEWQLITRNPVFRNQGLLSLLILGLLLFSSYKFFMPPSAEPPVSAVYHAVAQPGECLITIKVHADTLPSTKAIAMVGDHDSLGNWKTMVSLATTDSVTWQRTFAFPKSKQIAFKFTGGNWAYRATDAKGADLEPNFVTAKSDTSIEYTVNHWSGEKDKGNLFMPFYMAVFLTGFLMLMYGQNLLAYSATYYDALLTRNMSVREILKAKRTFMQLIAAAGFVVCIPFVIFNHNQAAWIFLSLMVYQIGFNSNLILLLAPYQRNGIDLNRKMNLRGNSPIQFVQTIGAFALPLLIFYLFETHVNTTIAFIVIFGIGLAAWVMQWYWLTLTSRIALKNKYLQSDAFRKTNA